MKKHRAYPSFQAFTLLEIMLVVAIISLLLGAAAVGIGHNMVTAKEVVARADITSYSTALTSYTVRTGRYPTTSQGLDALVNEPKTPPIPKRWAPVSDPIKQDPWGNDYIYVCPGRHNPTGFDLSSKGPDGEADTKDDISNWQSS